MLIAQITDTHILSKGKLLHHMVHTSRALRRCVAHLDALAPDVVVATGDLVDRGKPKEYRRLRKILARLPMRVLVLPGNHDDREAFREAFRDHPEVPQRGPIQWVVDTFSVRLIGLDTVRARHPGGELDDDRLAWLERALGDAPHRPTLVFMHHPPFEVGVPPMDAHGFRNLAAFERLIARHRQIVRVAAGHVHHAARADVAGVLAVSVPSTSHQMVLAGGRAGFCSLRLETPSFALHRWDGTQLATEILPVEAFAGTVRTTF